MPQKHADPLLVILEQHLLNFQDPDIDRRTLVLKVIADYINYLRKQNISVPRSLEQPIVEELYTQVNTLLIKKIYGCLSPHEFQGRVSPTIKRRARARYNRLQSRTGSTEKQPSTRRKQASVVEKGDRAKAVRSGS